MAAGARPRPSDAGRSRAAQGDRAGPGRRGAPALCASSRRRRLKASRSRATRSTRPGPPYTFETLEWLRSQRPDDELVFIAGADQAASLPRGGSRSGCCELPSSPWPSARAPSRDEVLGAIGSIPGGGERVSVLRDAADRSVVDRHSRAGRRGAAVPAAGPGARSPTGSKRRGSTGRPSRERPMSKRQRASRRRTPRAARNSWRGGSPSSRRTSLRAT